MVPYIGDLIGYRPLHGVAPAVASPRAEVANTIALSPPQGHRAVLEQLARDVTGWPAHAVEFFELLATTQYMKHVRLQAPPPPTCATSQRACSAVGGPFNALAHTAEMRRPESGAGATTSRISASSCGGCGRFALTAVPLTPDPGDAAGRKFRVNPLGADLQLVPPPQPRTTSAISPSRSTCRSRSQCG